MSANATLAEKLHWHRLDSEDEVVREYGEACGCHGPWLDEEALEVGTPIVLRVYYYDFVLVGVRKVCKLMEGDLVD